MTPAEVDNRADCDGDPGQRSPMTYVRDLALRLVEDTALSGVG
jgi:hypothetical protein